MDKTNLYYIVRKGTNQRILNMDKTPFTVQSECIDDILCEYPYHGNYHEKISVEEYERKF